MAAFAVHRFRFFGREAISFLLVLPLALPGIITGMALNSFFTFSGVDFSLTTIVIGHATFCIVDRLQQRARAAAPHAGVADRGLDGPRRRRLADVPLRDAADDRDGARRRRAARVRAVASTR